MRPGQSFEEEAVASFYQHRPLYPTKIIERLINLSPGSSRALDLGCGTGKIARGIASTFDTVTAVDASAAMLKVAATLQNGDAKNIKWQHGLAETVALPGTPFDLIVAAASVHWMDHAIVFPRLRSLVNEHHVFAVVDGDGAFKPPWQEAWDDFLARWILKLKGEKYEPSLPGSQYEKFMTRYRGWLNVDGNETHDSLPITQSVDDFIKCQHSRDTFTPSKLGATLEMFDDELREILLPFAEQNSISYTIRSSIEWGTIRIGNGALP